MHDGPRAASRRVLLTSTRLSDVRSGLRAPVKRISAVTTSLAPSGTSRAQAKNPGPPTVRGHDVSALPAGAPSGSQPSAGGRDGATPVTWRPAYRQPGRHERAAGPPAGKQDVIPAGRMPFFGAGVVHQMSAPIWGERDTKKKGFAGGPLWPCPGRLGARTSRSQGRQPVMASAAHSEPQGRTGHARRGRVSPAPPGPAAAVTVQRGSS
jgi:hypothetical protein